MTTFLDVSSSCDESRNEFRVLNPKIATRFLRLSHLSSTRFPVLHHWTSTSDFVQIFAQARLEELLVVQASLFFWVREFRFQHLAKFLLTTVPKQSAGTEAFSVMACDEVCQNTHPLSCANSAGPLLIKKQTSFLT